MSDLDEITRGLGKEYRTWKEAEKAKDRYKKKFFEAINETLREEVPQQVVQKVEATDEEEALRIAQRMYPRFRTVDCQPDDDDPGQWNVILEENPELKDFAHTNKTDGNVYQRIIAEGTPSLDDEGLKDEQPALWEAITTEVTTRELRPLDELTPEQVAAIQPYITMPKPQARLGAPRKAKEEELEDANHD